MFLIFRILVGNCGFQGIINNIYFFYLQFELNEKYDKNSIEDIQLKYICY